MTITELQNQTREAQKLRDAGFSYRDIAFKLGVGKTQIPVILARKFEADSETANKTDTSDSKTANKTDVSDSKTANKADVSDSKAANKAGNVESTESLKIRLNHQVEMKKLQMEEARQVREEKAANLTGKITELQSENVKAKSLIAKAETAALLESELKTSLLFVYGRICANAYNNDGEKITEEEAQSLADYVSEFMETCLEKGKLGAALMRSEIEVMETLLEAFSDCAKDAAKAKTGVYKFVIPIDIDFEVRHAANLD